MRKIIRFYNKDGFTVIEMLMAIIILGVVMAAITTMIIQSFNIFDSSTRRMSAGQLAELTLSEVGGHLRSITDPVESDFGNNDIWIFNGFHPDNEAGISKFEFELKNDGRLLLSVSDTDINEKFISEKVVINNVKNFYITEVSNNEFEIFIEVEDGEGNIAKKRISVNSRNI